MAGGRPRTYTPEFGKEICDIIGACHTPISKLCAQHDNWPTHVTLWQWTYDFPEFSKLYDRARENRANLMEEQILEIADDSSRDKTTDSEGNERTDWEVVQRSRLRVDSRKWLMSKMCPRKYSDKLDVAGIEQQQPLQLNLVQVIQTLSANPLGNMIAQLMAPQPAAIEVAPDAPADHSK